MIALLCSVPLEAETLLASLKKIESCDLGSTTFHRGTLARHEVALCAAGMGKVNAAHASTLLITRYAPEALVIFGVGGAYPSSGATVARAWAGCMTSSTVTRSHRSRGIPLTS